MSNSLVPTIECVVVGREEVAENVVQFTLRPTVHRPMPAWRPGAHIDLMLPIGAVRNYSLCGDPADRWSWTVAVLREADGRGGSEYIHSALNVGDQLKVRGPRNNFALGASNSYNFIIGGIGVTPILPMLRQLYNKDAGANVRVLYGGRSRRSMAFVEDVLGFAGNAIVWPQDEFGYLDIAGFLGDAPPDSLVYACGPEGLLAAVEGQCQEEHLDLRVERFRAEESTEAMNEAFRVRLAQTGETVNVGADESLLEALRASGAVVLSSCEEGTCGTCETTLVEGAAVHRDAILSGSERTRGALIYPCVSRGRSGGELVLDL